MTTRARFDLYIDSPGMGPIHAADCVVEEEAGFVRRVDFRYTPDYLGQPTAFPLDPRRLPLESGEIRFACQGGVPGFIDDHLPDAILAATAACRGLTIVTRNASEFRNTGVAFVDPWATESR